ncbi:hypothetical protein V7112_08655 [Bacillus sp. JJ1566]|uniref:hypothetical protein n=1 Tax=Bacillus sp. JJ1566 TaxID=3122961 RepID=UPI002FFFC1D6
MTRKTAHGDVVVTILTPDKMEKYCRERGLTPPSEVKKKKSKRKVDYSIERYECEKKRNEA